MPGQTTQPQVSTQQEPSSQMGQPTSTTTWGQPNQPGQTTQRNGIATAGFVCSIIGLLIFPLEIIGLILSSIGLARSKRLNGTGRSIAIAGIVLGIVGVIILIIAISDGNFFIWE